METDLVGAIEVEDQEDEEGPPIRGDGSSPTDHE